MAIKRKYEPSIEGENKVYNVLVNPKDDRVKARFDTNRQIDITSQQLLPMFYQREIEVCPMRILAPFHYTVYQTKTVTSTSGNGMEIGHDAICEIHFRPHDRKSHTPAQVRQ